MSVTLVKTFPYAWQGEKGEPNTAAQGMKGEPGSPGLQGSRGPKVRKELVYETPHLLLNTTNCMK